MDVLPFAEDDCEISLARDLTTLNDNAQETWTKLRRTRPKVASYDLSLLPDVQIDILLEILAYLHPLELIQVARTTKSLRAVLLSPVADSTWRTSFRLDEYAPRPPEGFPARRWAKLLFGPRICDLCHTPRVDANYTIWRRLCLACETAHSSDDAIPESKNHGERFDIDAGTHDAVVRKIQSITDDCNAWEEENASTLSSRQYQQRDLVDEQIRKRLVKEGFAKADVYSYKIYEAVWECPVLARKPRLTSTVWHLARPYILPAVLETQGERLAQERRILFDKRLNVINAASLLALRMPIADHTLPHMFLPPPHTFATTYPPLVDLMNDPSDDLLSRDDPRLLSALSDPAARNFVDGLWTDLQMRLAGLVDTSGDLASLERAGSVFLISKGGYNSGGRSRVPAIGWEEARARLHWCHGAPVSVVGEAVDVEADPYEGRIEFCALGSSTAATLTELLGYDNPQEVSIKRMDMKAVDERFICANCPPVLQGRGRREAFRWRECILHDIEASELEPSHRTPSWLRLTPLTGADARRREGDDSYDDLQMWTCTICDTYRPWFVKHHHIYHHIQTAHNIDSPNDGEHMICFALPERPARKRAVLIEGVHAATLRCNRCVLDHPGVVKLWAKRAIVPHLRDRHLLDSRMVGEAEWTEVDVFCG
ncbi:hypothetical protein C8F01DRAFT_447397 [Mycena amicta]|nr:hypothetical protein C8F01DRAFT_447397 [Mycena amicta]